MAQLVAQMRASYGFIERNFNLVRRYWGWEVVWLAYSIANALAITFIGAGMEAISGQAMDTEYLIMFLLAGTLIWHFLSIVFDAISEVIAWERWEGTIEYTFMAPVSRITHMLGQTAFSLVYALLHTAIILGVVALFFRLDLSEANLGGGLLVLLAGSLSFIGLGIVASVMPLLFPERGAQMTHVIQASLLLVSGTYVLEGVRGALLAGTPTAELWRYVWPLLVMGVILIPAGVWVFGQAERYAKRTGKLKRNG
jgi:ABC-2 type transport system permease protein